MTFPTTHPALARALAAREYAVPTAVQLAVLEPDAAGQDLLVSAQTGSGKTVAFGLALAPTLIADAEKFDAASAPLALVVAPTRELALQVQRELDWLYAETGAKVVTCVGGMDVRTEARALNFGAHIVVGTPGRLRDHLERKRLDLSKLKAVVLDEADEMLDLGFREDLEFLLDATPAERRTLLFSATMPREIESLATSYQRDAHRIATANKNEQHADIEYRAIRVAPSDVENAVVNVLRFHESRATLVFCATRESVKRMHARLLERGFAAVALSGELTQAERSHALQALRDGRARVLVATDVAARGLDLPDLALVIHAELPNNAETLLHRSGRTGRAGKKGLCVLIVPFNRRRKSEALLGAARLRVKWEPAPTADEIRQRDRERFMADPMFAETPTEDDQAWARTLQEGRTADEIALALVRLCRARLPEPEELMPDQGPPRRDRDVRPHRGQSEGFAQRDGETPDRERRYERSDRNSDGQRPPRAPRPPREDNREMTWFRLNIGRDRNADPRWLLPLICRAGGVTKSEIGAIRIQDRDTRFQIAAEFADQFAETVRTSKNKEGHISRVGPRTDADDAAVMDAIDALPPIASPKVEAVTPVPEPTSETTAAETSPDAPQSVAAGGDERPRWKKRDKERSDRPRTFARETKSSEPDAAASSGPTESRPSWRKRDNDRPFSARPPRGDAAPSSTERVRPPRRHEDPPHWHKHDKGKPKPRPFSSRPSEHADAPSTDAQNPAEGGGERPRWQKRDRDRTDASRSFGDQQGPKSDAVGNAGSSRGGDRAHWQKRDNDRKDRPRSFSGRPGPRPEGATEGGAGSAEPSNGRPAWQKRDKPKFDGSRPGSDRPPHERRKDRGPASDRGPNAHPHKPKQAHKKKPRQTTPAAT